jgi:hypothetical protein
VKVRRQTKLDSCGVSCHLMNANDVFNFLVAKQFDISTITGGDSTQTWATLLDAVLKARTEMDPKKADPVIWKAFLLYAFVLVPCVQSW